MTKRSVASFSAIAILLWVLPLGAFIKADQEKTACHGSRAMHMCTMEFGTASSSSSSVVRFDSGTSSEQTPKAKVSGGAEPLLEEIGLRSLRREGLVAVRFEIMPRSYLFPTTTPPPKSPLFF